LDAWASVSTAFTAVLAASIPLDTDGPFLLFHNGVFFATPSRGLALVLAMALLGSAWRKAEQRWRLASGIALGVLVWLDLAVSLWVILALVLGEVLVRVRDREGGGLGPTFALGIASLLSRGFFHAAFDPLSRVPKAEEVRAVQTVFRDVGFVTLDMRWVFVFSALGTYFLWRRARASDIRIVSMLTAAYISWVAGGIAFHVRPFSDTEALFHLVRFNVAFVAGIGAWEAFRKLWELGHDSGGARIRRWVERVGSGALAFACVVLVLLPESAAFVWRPATWDPLHYPSTYAWDESVRRLERWLLEQTGPNAVVLTGDETGEWVASLTGRRVLSAERVLGRDLARQHRRELRRLFLSGEPEAMRAALDALGADILILDPGLREVYWELDEPLLESSGLFRKVHQIGDRYAIYVTE